MKRQKLTIIGAGPIGLLCAFFAVEKGFEIKIIAKLSGENQNCAGLAAGGMLAPTFEFAGETENDFVDFAFSSRELWNNIAKELNVEIKTDAFAVSNSENIERLLNSRQMKIEIENLQFAGNFQSAIRLCCDGLINPRECHSKMMEYLMARGVTFIDESVIAINNGEIQTETNFLEYEDLIIAAGVGSLSFANEIKELEAIVPVRGQLVEIKTNSPVDGTIRMGKIYALSRSGRTIIGATAARNDDNWSLRASDNRQLLNAPHALADGFTHENISAVYCGVRPASLDNYPIIGKSSRENVYLACGAYRNGWLLAPQIGKDLITLLIEGVNNFPHCFSPGRFAKS